MADSLGDARLEQLERRVRNDPTSVAFAALAEEYRRAGRLEEAIETCRAGLMRHPAYLSARVTLGRALMETGALEEAEAELQRVVSAAPENLAAIRCLAEIHHRRGDDHEHDAHHEPAPAEPPAPPAEPASIPDEPVAAAPADAPAEPAQTPAVPAEAPAAPAQAPAAVVSAPAEPAGDYGAITPEALDAPEATTTEPVDPVIADLEEFLGQVVARRIESAPR